jgi:predicted PurR-regulated permease PerM
MKIHFIPEGTTFENSYVEQKANIKKLVKHIVEKIISLGYWLVSFSFSIIFCVLMLKNKNNLFTTKGADDLLLLFGGIIIVVSMTKITTIFIDIDSLQDQLKAAKKKLKNEVGELIKKSVSA